MKARTFWIPTGCVLLAAAGGGLVVALDGTASTGYRAPKVRGDLEGISAALTLYENNAGRFPTTEQGLSALVIEPIVEPIPDVWREQLKWIPLDPWGREYRYRYPGSHLPESFDLFSLGVDGVVSDDDEGNWGEY